MRDVQQYQIFFSETRIVAGELNETLTHAHVRVVQHD